MNITEIKKRIAERRKQCKELFDERPYSFASLVLIKCSIPASCDELEYLIGVVWKIKATKPHSGETMCAEKALYKLDEIYKIIEEATDV